MSRDFKEFKRKVANRNFAVDNSWQADCKSFEEPVSTRSVGEWYVPKQLPWEQLNENLQEADSCKYFDGYLPIESSKKWVIFLKKGIRKLIKICLGWYIFPQYQRLSHFHGKIVNAVSLQRDILVGSIEQNQKLADKISEQEATFKSCLGEQEETFSSRLGEQETRFNTCLIKEKELLNAQIEEQKKAVLSMLKQMQAMQARINVLAEENEQLKQNIRKIENLPTEDDDFYHDFEEKFRGSEDDIRDRLRVYLPKLKEHLQDWSQAVFIDVGSGRGEWLDLLRENGARNYVGIDLNERQNALCAQRGHRWSQAVFIDVGSGRGEWLDLLRENGARNYVGIDLNERQNALCAQRGHRVLQMDCIEYLKSLPENSVDLVTGFQIVEHLCMSDLMALIKESHRVLKRSGMILFETQNPRNLTVGADTFYIDPSHKRPLDPRMLSFFVEWCGYSCVECIDANSGEESAALKLPDAEKDEQEYRLIKEFNDIKWLLFGPQDYAIFAVKE